MNLTIKMLTGIVAAGGLATAAQSQTDKAAPKTTPPAKIAVETPKVPAALKGKLIRLKGDTVVDAEISPKLEYYVIYQSASW
jgi:hypothetical protein